MTFTSAEKDYYRQIHQRLREYLTCEEKEREKWAVWKTKNSWGSKRELEVLYRRDAADTVYPSPEELVLDAERRSFIMAALESSIRLRRDWAIIESRLFLSDSRSTLQELGDDLNISRSRVRDVEQRILRHLHSKLQPST